MENSSRDGNTRPLTHLLRNLYADQEKTVRTRRGTTDWLQIGKGICQDCVLTYLTYMQSTSCKMPRLDEAQAGIKTAGRNINNLK